MLSTFYLLIHFHMDTLSTRLSQAITSDDVTPESVIARITQLRKTLCTKEQRAKAFQKLHAYDSLEAHYNRMVSNHCSAF